MKFKKKEKKKTVKTFRKWESLALLYQNIPDTIMKGLPVILYEIVLHITLKGSQDNTVSCRFSCQSLMVSVTIFLVGIKYVIQKPSQFGDLLSWSFPK